MKYEFQTTVKLDESKLDELAPQMLEYYITYAEDENFEIENLVDVINKRDKKYYKIEHIVIPTDLDSIIKGADNSCIEESYGQLCIFIDKLNKSKEEIGNKLGLFGDKEEQTQIPASERW